MDIRICWVVLIGTMLLIMRAAMAEEVRSTKPTLEKGEVDAANGRQTARPCVTLTGTDSHVNERSYHRIASEDEWIKVWQRHKGAKESKTYDLFYNPLGLPSIDFEKYMVIAVFQGSDWNNAGLKADAVLEEKDGIVLRFANKRYQTAGPDGGGKKTTVYAFFVLPLSNKTVVLEESVANMQDPTPRWEQRVRLPK
jgi:hypothetical protein